ncbi:uncharacterized protein EHS24_005298 [Apiotrichum porosum]|uniref:FAD-binding domain-containing protein n=1 Tax=Apiotrichum porosum TaxID=105984 RepID=A0A427XD29_9TREE|nr:uncharacterized protein EHS24_005298 [Apiotrichum porosum]RSH76722.1 hypothetical protein EHS24_005298 [Apiotrichum porosum]
MVANLPHYYHPRTYAPSQVESTPTGSSLPVVVVGAGPAGLATALSAAKRGVKVTVIDQGTSASYGSRATCYSRHTMEIAQRLGYGDQLESRALAWTGGRSFYHDREILEFKMPHSSHSALPPMVNIGQCEYEEMQITAAEKDSNITILWGVTLTGLESDADGVTLTVDSAGGERKLSADRVVASDGGQSKVRKLTGLHLQGTAYEGRYIIADIHWISKLPTQRMVWFDPPSNPGSTVIMHKQPDNIWRIDYQLLPGEDVAAQTTEEAIMARITKHLAWLENNGTITAQPWTLQWHSFYKAMALALPSFVHGRIVFAGDAAHLVPIFGVRGLNSAMEDGDVLGWMIAAVAHGDADESLLKVYSQERRDAWEQNIASAGKSTLIMTPGSDGYRTTRDALLRVAEVMPEFRHLIDPRQSSATHALRSSLSIPGPGDTPELKAGEPLEDRRLVIDGVETSLNKARGYGFGVFAIAPVDHAEVDSVVSRIQTALPHEQIKAVVLEQGSDGGCAAAWNAKAGEVVIVRPDGLVLSRGLPSQLGAFDVRLRGLKLGVNEATDPVLSTPEQLSRESVWLQLSKALDSTDDKAALMTRLALVLGAEAGSKRVEEVLRQVA